VQETIQDFARESAGVPDVGDLEARHQLERFRPVGAGAAEPLPGWRNRRTAPVLVCRATGRRDAEAVLNGGRYCLYSRLLLVGR
jgi:hypothetical protein